MRDHAAFEARLAEAFDRYVAAAPVAIDARALTGALATAHAGRPTLADRWTAVVGVRRVAPVLLLLLLALATAVVGALALRLLDQPARMFGAFEPIRGWAPTGYEDAVSLADGRVLVVEGDGRAWLYDASTGQARAVGPVEPPRYGMRLAALADGRAVALGGRVFDEETGDPTNMGTALLFDAATGAFAEVGATLRHRQDPATALMGDGRVLVVGGEGISDDSAEIFDPRTGRFERTGDPTLPRTGGRAVALADGRILVAGGWTHRMNAMEDIQGVEAPQRPIAHAEIFDPATGAFTSLGSTGIARIDPSLTLLADGQVLIAGGRDENGYLASAQLFDPTTGRFAATGSLATERSGHVATLLPDGRVLVTGGQNQYGDPRTAEIYDPVTGRFDLAGTTSEGTWSAAAQPDGTVVVLGWSQPERWHPTEPAPAPATERVPGPGFVVTGSPVVDRLDHTATLLADGRVLVTGGRTQDLVDGQPPDVLASAEVFDPRSGRFERVADMARPRVRGSAIRLLDGRVLVVGGDVSTNPWVNGVPLTAEVYDPATGSFSLLDNRIAWGRTECDVELTPFGDGRAVLLAGCPAGDATQVFDPVTGWAEPVPFDVEGCDGDGPAGEPPRVVAAGNDVVVLCPGNGAAAYLFDPDDDAATPLGPVVPEPSWITGAAALPDGRILLVTERDVRILDPATRTVTPVGPLADHRAGGRVTALPDGRVLITGGRAATTTAQGYGGPPLAAADTWDPAAGLRVVGPMADGRAGHTATALPDGRVLLVGGVERSPDRTDPEPVGAEIFDPAAVP
jgi:hypothetical protein